MLANYDADSMEPIGYKTFCNQKAIKLLHFVRNFGRFSLLYDEF